MNKDEKGETTENLKKKDNSFLMGLVSGAVAIVLVFLILSATTSLDLFGGDRGGKTQSQNENSGKAMKAADDEPVLKNEDKGGESERKDDIRVEPTDHIRGNVNAPITIVEFSDFQCSFCAKFHQTMSEVMELYPNDVRWVYKHFPLDRIHPSARAAAEASECAADQGMFWEYADGLFESQNSINTAFLSTLARDIGLDEKEFASCIEAEKGTGKVDADFQQGTKNGVTGTPGSFINGQKLNGAVPLEQITAIIESLK